MENENTPYPGLTDQHVGHEAARYGEDAKSGVTKQDAALFNVQEARAVRVIHENLGGELTAITRKARFIEDLKADSLDMIQLVMDLETEFGIQISDDETEKVQTVDDAFRLIADKVPA